MNALDHPWGRGRLIDSAEQLDWRWRHLVKGISKSYKQGSHTAAEAALVAWIERWKGTEWEKRAKAQVKDFLRQAQRLKPDGSYAVQQED